MVISKAGHGATRLAYMAALVPEPGETAADVAGSSVSELCNAAMIASTDGARLSLDADKSVAALYHLCSPEDAAHSIARQRSAPSWIFGELVATPAWLARPATYIVCTDDRALEPRYQRLAAAKMADSSDLRADHSAFFSAPAGLATTLTGLARACLG